MEVQNYIIKQSVILLGFYWDDNGFGRELSDNFKQAGWPRQEKQEVILAAVSSWDHCSHSQ